MSTTSTAGSPATPLKAAIPIAAWLGLAVILCGEVMDMLDAMITNVAGPTIMHELGTGESFIQWLAAGYTIAMAAGLLIGGRLGDVFGRKPLFLIGIAGFTLASLASALATGPEMLIGARLVQGLLGAMMLPQGLGMIREMFPPSRASAAFGAFGPIMGLGAVGGPVLAGWLVSADYLGWGWRMIFAINIPIGVIGFIGGLKYLPKALPNRALGLDWLGAALAAVGLAALIFPLVEGREYGWPMWIFALLALSGVALGGFAWRQNRQDLAGRPTLVEPSLFRKPAYVAGLVLGLFVFIPMMGLGLVSSLILQLGLGLSPIETGVALIGQAAGMMVGFVIAQKFGANRAVMRVGLVVLMLGFGVFAATLLIGGSGLSAIALTPALLVLGVGGGLAMAPFFGLVMGTVDDHESGSAAGALTAIQQVGGALGAAVLGTIFYQALGASTAITDFESAGTWTLIAAIVLTACGLVLTRWLPAEPAIDAEH